MGGSKGLKDQILPRSREIPSLKRDDGVPFACELLAWVAEARRLERFKSWGVRSFGSAPCHFHYLGSHKLGNTGANLLTATRRYLGKILAISQLILIRDSRSEIPRTCLGKLTRTQERANRVYTVTHREIPTVLCTSTRLRDRPSTLSRRSEIGNRPISKVHGSRF